MSDSIATDNEAGAPAIVPGEPDDVAAIQAIEIDAGRRFATVGLTAIAEAPPDPAPGLLAAIDDDRLLIAVDGDRPVGYIRWSTVDENTHIEQVSVAESHGGQGIGGRLIDEVCDRAEADGHRFVTLTTFRDVAWNGPLYQRYGFEELDLAEAGPELVERRREETDAGLDVEPRIAMRRALRPRRSGRGPH